MYHPEEIAVWPHETNHYLYKRETEMLCHNFMKHPSTEVRVGYCSQYYELLLQVIHQTSDHLVKPTMVW